MRISLCLISSKGDVEKAKSLVSSLQEHVDEVCLTVTCPYFNEEIPGVKVSNFKWVDDFSKARNFNFSQATGDWILWLDADDALKNPEKIRDLVRQAEANKLSGYWVMYEYGHDASGNCVDKHWKAQLLKNDGHFTWKGKIHEDPIQLRPVKWSTTEAITRVHNTDGERAHKSFERNLRILLKEVEADPTEPRTKFYLGRTYNAMGEFEKAITILQEYLKLSGWDDERYEARMIIASSLIQLGSTDEALITYNDSIMEKESNPDAYLGKAHCYMAKEEWNKALYNFKIAMELPVPDAVTFFNPMSYTRDLYHGVAWCYLNLAKLTEAQQAAETALSYDANDKNVKSLLQAILSSKGKHDLARKYIDIAKYLESRKQSALPLLHAVPPELADHELIVALRNRISPPKEWKPGSLAVFCGTSAEDWTPDSQNTGGIGGSETAVIELTKRLAKKGWDITVYNQGNHPPEGRVYDGVKYQNYWTFNMRDKFNVLWVWRLPELFDFDIDAKLSLLDLHDVMSPHDFPPERARKIDKIFVKTKYHRSLFPQVSDDKFVVVGNGIDLSRFAERTDKGETNFRCCYTSSPNRGLDVLLKMWPKIYERYKDDKSGPPELHVYYGWNTFYHLEKNNPERMMWMKKVQAMMNQPGVIDHGRVGQAELAKDLLTYTHWLYPTDFPEIDCITVKEMQAAGLFCVSSGYAALAESQVTGRKLPGDTHDPKWQENFIDSLSVAYEPAKVQQEAKQFSWDLVADKWQEELSQAA